MKPYKLISLDEYETYIKWKNDQSSSNSQSISNEQEKGDISVEKKVNDNSGKQEKEKRDISAEKNVNNLSSDIIESEIEKETASQKNEINDDSIKPQPLPPPGRPLKVRIEDNYYSHKAHGKQREWIRQWRKSIR